MLLTGTVVYPQGRRTSTQRPTPTKPPVAPTQPPKRVAVKETAAEKIVLEGVCKTPNPLEWMDAWMTNISMSSRSESTLFRMPDVLLRAELLFHILSAGSLKAFYEAKAYKTDIFPQTYEKNEAGLKELMAKIEDFKKERGSVSSWDRRALYPVVKAYFVDRAVFIRGLPPSSMRANFLAAYKENEKLIEEMAKSIPEEGLSPYTDKETPLLRTMTAYVIDYAIFVRDSYQVAAGTNLTAAFEKLKPNIETLAAKQWKSEELSGDEKDALREILEASSADVANLLRAASRSPTRGSFGEVFGKHSDDIENLASRNFEKRSFSASAPALCTVLRAYRGM